MTTEVEARGKVAQFGVRGLDAILRGGLTASRTYLLEGSPGTGKTTLGLQFLLEGARSGERGMLISLSESEAELHLTAEAHGWDLSGIDIDVMASAEDLLDPALDQSLLYSSDLELGETTRKILRLIQDLRPARVVIDSLSELRLLAQSGLRYRRQLLALKQAFAQLGQTVLLLDHLTTAENETTVHSLVHGVIRLTELAPVYGGQRRQIRVTKFRGVPFRGGFHDMEIVRGGVEVFPRLVAAGTGRPFAREDVATGVEGLDVLLGGGIARGTTTMFVGPTGVGKTVASMQVIDAALRRGERAAMFIFDEDVGLLAARMRGIGFALEDAMASGALTISQIDPAEQPPGAFAERIRAMVIRGEAQVVLIDSLNGYYAGMPEEQYLVLHMHELSSFLNRHGVVTLLTVAQHGLLGDIRSPVDLTYLCDTLLLLRYYEADGALRRAVSVVKKRSGAHEQGIHAFEIGRGGLRIGGPAVNYEGVLRGAPVRVMDPATTSALGEGSA